MDVDLVILHLRSSSSNNGKMITIGQIIIINSVAVVVALIAITIMAAVMERHMSCRLYQLIIGTMWHSTLLKIIISTTMILPPN